MNNEPQINLPDNAFLKPEFVRFPLNFLCSSSPLMLPFLSAPSPLISFLSAAFPSLNPQALPAFFLLFPAPGSPSGSSLKAKTPQLPRRHPPLHCCWPPLYPQSNQTKALSLTAAANLLKISFQRQPPDHHYPAATTLLITEDAPQDNGLQILMPPVNFPLAS